MNKEDFTKEYEEFIKGNLGLFLPVFNGVSFKADKWLFLKLSRFFEDVHTIAENSKNK